MPLRSLAALSPRQLLALALRGRTWIGIVAAGLIGLVTMQLIVLELNTSIGRSLQHAAALHLENDSLAIANSEASSGESVEAQARALGMIDVAPGELHFVHAMPLRQASIVADMLLRMKPFAAASLGSSTGAFAAGASSFVTSPAGETTLATSQEGQVAAAAEASPASASAQPSGGEEAAAVGAAAGAGVGAAPGAGASAAAGAGQAGGAGTSAGGAGQGSGAAGEAAASAGPVSAGGGTQAGAGG